MICSRIAISILLILLLQQLISGEADKKPLGVMKVENIAKSITEGNYAIIIGVNDYFSDDISDLKYCENDAKNFATALQARGWNPNNIHLLTGSKASYENIYDAVFNLANLKTIPGDSTIIFFFSGHGVSLEGKNYLAPWDSSVKDTLVSVKNIDVEVVEDALNNSPFKRKFIFLDACRNIYSLNQIDLLAKGFASLTTKAEIKVFLSTKEGEYSIEDLKLLSGVFTYYLIDSLLDDKTDGDKDGVICIAELEHSIAKKMDDYSIANNKNQHLMTRGESDPLTPIAIVSKGMSGEESPITPRLRPELPKFRQPISFMEVDLKNSYGPWDMSIAALDISPDGKYLAIATTLGGIALCTMNMQNQLNLTGHTNMISTVAFSPDGLTCASASWDQTIKIWSVETGKEIQTLNGHTEMIYSMAISPDGKTLISGSENAIIIWTTDTWEKIKTIQDCKFASNSLAFSPDGDTFAWGTLNGNAIILCSSDTYQTTKTLYGHDGAVSCLTFSPDGSILATGSWDKTIKLWALDTGWVIRTLNGHTEKINTMDFSPDSRILSSGSYDNTVRLWSIENGKEIFTLTEHMNSIEDIVFSPDGHQLITATGYPENTLRFWDINY